MLLSYPEGGYARLESRQGCGAACKQSPTPTLGALLCMVRTTWQLIKAQWQNSDYILRAGGF